jgi:hypothetical protein
MLHGLPNLDLRLSLDQLPARVTLSLRIWLIWLPPQRAPHSGWMKRSCGHNLDGRIDAIVSKARQKFTAKAKAKKEDKPVSKAKKA